MTQQEFIEQQIKSGKDYISDVKAGKIICNEFIALMMERWDEVTSRDRVELNMNELYKFFAFTFLCRIEVKKKWVVAKLEPWQCFLVLNIFLWDKERNAPWYDTFLLHVSRKAGKTTLASLLLLYDMLDSERGQSFSFANTLRQAKICYKSAKAIIEHSPELKSLKCLEVTKTEIRNLSKDGELAALVSDPEKLDGLGCSASVIDEPHENDKFEELLGVIVTGQGLRDESRNYIISTAGFSTKSSYYNFVEQGKKVLRGELNNDRTFYMIFCLDDPKTEWDNPQAWFKANPMLGVTIQLWKYEDLFDKAMKEESKKLQFIVKNLNIFLKNSTSWIDDKLVKACFKPIDWSKFKGMKCYVGIDSSSLVDVTSVSRMVFDWEVGEFYFQVMHFLPDNERALNRKDGISFSEWVDSGYIEIIDNKRMDFERVKEVISEWDEETPVEVIGFDSHNSTYLANEMDSLGLYTMPCPPTTYKVTKPLGMLEAAIYSGECIIEPCPVTRYSFGNVRLMADTAGNRKYNKTKSLETIDPVVAMINSMMCFEELELNNEENENMAYYKELKEGLKLNK